VKTDPEQAGMMVRLAMNLIRLYAIVSRPFIPDASASMMTAVGSDNWAWPEDLATFLTALPAGHAFSVPENLFRKITDEERVEWQQRFSGIRV
jgi:methionyl-tRNA synthetase